MIPIEMTAIEIADSAFNTITDHPLRNIDTAALRSDPVFKQVLADVGEWVGGAENNTPREICMGMLILIKKFGYPIDVFEVLDQHGI